MVDLELILYEISGAWMLIASFLIILFLTGCILYIITKDFNFKGRKIKAYGLLLSISDKNIWVASMMIVRTFLIIFPALVYQENQNMYLIMIGISSFFFLIFYLRNIIYEIINTVALIAIVHFIYQLDNYLIEVEDSFAIQIIRLILMSFAVIYAIYIFLKEFEDITTSHENINE